MLSVQTHQAGSRLHPLRKCGLRTAFRALVYLGFLAACVFALNLPAQTPKKPAAAAPAAVDNRFLFIVDTSTSMKRHQKEVEEAVYDILLSSASGQMHRGDSIGVWTFNTDVYTGNIPLQTCEPDKQEEIAMRTAGFLQRQSYGRTSHLDAALSGMYEVIKRSGIITVFIISDGDGKMQGTPFDQEINDLYAQSIKEMKKKRMPIVTVLQGNAGKLDKYTVNALPWPVIIPEVPIPIKGAETALHKPAPAASPKMATAAAPVPKPPAPAAVTAPPPQPKATAPAPAPPPAAKLPEQSPVTASAVAPDSNSPAMNIVAEMLTASAVPATSLVRRANPPNNGVAGNQTANQTPLETPTTVEKTEAASTPPPANVPAAPVRANVNGSQDVPGRKAGRVSANDANPDGDGSNGPSRADRADRSAAACNHSATGQVHHSTIHGADFSLGRRPSKNPAYRRSQSAGGCAGFGFIACAPRARAVPSQPDQPDHESPAGMNAAPRRLHSIRSQTVLRYAGSSR